MKLFKYVNFRHELEQNNASKQKVGHCDKTTLQFFFHFYNSEYLCFIDIPCQNSAKISSQSGEEVDFVVFAIFSNSGLLGYST